jgi:alcohol dehydrogenase (cytochrome c)
MKRFLVQPIRLLAAALLAVLIGCQADAPAPGADSSATTGDTVVGATELTFERLVNADQEPENWLMYSGNYSGNRHSLLDQINRDTVAGMEIAWVHQFNTLSTVETSPVVVDGMMYVTESPSTVIALDAATGRPFWKYEHQVADKLTLCCGENNRGVAVLGERVFVGTVDARLIALDAKTGSVLWNVEVGEASAGYSITNAPLVVKDMVITGIAGGEYGIRGFLDAYDVETGERRWRFYTIPDEGEPGNDTWGGDSWKYGGAPTWVTGSYDPETNLLYWGTGNPAPDWNGDARPGDNLYSDSVVALDADTGELQWHFQFTPHDTHDWDAVQVPILANIQIGGSERKLMLWGNRNAFYYVLDRNDGEFLRAQAFAKQTWAEGMDESGRPILIPGMDPTEEGIEVFPGITGGTNWWSPSFSPTSNLFYVRAYDGADIFYKRDDDFEEGDLFLGGYGEAADEPENVTTAIRALDPLTGDLRWEYPIPTSFWGAGILTTAGGLVISGTGDGYVFALDDATGDELWHMSVGGQVHAGPVSYSVDGRQYVSITANHALFTFALR